MTVRVENILNLLRGHPLVESLRVVHYDETPEGKLELKIRCRLPEGYQLQVWLHYEPTWWDYSYQLFTDRPILRWDNSPFHPGVSTSPHHFHDELGQVGESRLSGEPLQDIAFVLVEVGKWLSKSTVR
jgi:hypothetical protein